VNQRLSVVEIIFQSKPIRSNPRASPLPWSALRLRVRPPSPFKILSSRPASPQGTKPTKNPLTPHPSCLGALVREPISPHQCESLSISG
jgi:hypothetical protein